MRRREAANRAARRAVGRVRRRVATWLAPPRRAALAALTASAMSLPGIAGSALAQGVVEELTVSSGTSYYRENDLSDSDVAVGQETERMEIVSQQFRIQAPFTKRTDVEIDVMYEKMSGASPWFVEPDPNTGKPLQVMSGASIEDERVDVLGKWNYHLDNGGYSVFGGVSTEDDYFSANGGLSARIDVNENNTSLDVSGSFSVDKIEPSNAGQSQQRTGNEDKESFSGSAAISQVLTRDSIAQLHTAVEYGQGFLSDPYKLVSVGGVNLADNRPDERTRFAAGTRYRHHFGRLGGTLHADYTFQWDTWGVRANTLEVGWWHTLWNGRLRVVPSLRYYTQTEADFYALYFNTLPSNGEISSDYRLSTYGALAGGLKAEMDLPDWFRRLRGVASISYEYYEADGDLSLDGENNPHPGLVGFNLARFNLAARW